LSYIFATQEKKGKRKGHVFLALQFDCALFGGQLGPMVPLIHYCAPFVCDLNGLVGLAVWRLYKPTNKTNLGFRV